MISFKPRPLRIRDKPSSVFGVLLRPVSVSGIRYASLTHAIERGKRQAQAVEAGSKSHWQGRGRISASDKPKNKHYSPPGDNQSSRRPKSQDPDFDLDTNEFIKTGKIRPRDRRDVEEDKWSYDPQSHEKKKGSWITRGDNRERLHKGKTGRYAHQYSDAFPERVKEHVKVPDSIPYTTAASEFIYGASAVEAALRCSRRKLYKLYVYQAKDQELNAQQNAIRKMALAQGITVKMAFAEWEGMLTKMSGGRPHNGFVLEASPLPQLPIAHLEPVPDPTATSFHVKLSPQSEEEAKVNGTSNEISRLLRPDQASQSRYPLILLVDGILDPGNMGAIIRSAYYLGVDGIIYAGRNSAPISPVTIKASAGATENMTLFKTVNPQEFIQASRQNGWRFLAADSPSNVFERSATGVVTVNRAAGTNTTSLLHEAPTVLMLGNEGTGLMERLKVRADGFISIPGARFQYEYGTRDAAGVDSLNVSVAAAMLIEMLMRTPLQVTDMPRVEKKEAETSSASETEGGAAAKVVTPSFDFN